MSDLNNFLVDLTYLKRNSLINGNVEDEKLTVVLRRTQKQRVEPILGTPLYKDLLSKVNNFSPDETILMDDYILPVLGIYCEIGAAVYQNTAIRNKSTGRSNDEHQTANTPNDNAIFISSLYKDAKTYERTLIGYLCDNEDKFPLYLERTGDREDVKPKPDQDSWDDTISFIF